MIEYDVDNKFILAPSHASFCIGDSPFPQSH